MRLRNDCRNAGELLKLKEGTKQGDISRIRVQMRDNQAENGKDLITRRNAFRTRFKAAVHPHILLRRHQYAFLNNFIHP